MAVTSSSPFFLFWVLQDRGSYSCLSPAEEVVAALNLQFIWAQTTFTLEQKERSLGVLNNEQSNCPVHEVLTKLKVLLSWSDAGLCFAFGIKNVHSQKGF